MEQIITVSCQLKTDNLLASELNNTFEVFADSYNWINQNIDQINKKRQVNLQIVLLSKEIKAKIK